MSRAWPAAVLAAIVAFVAALVFAFVVADASRPGTIFPKYLAAAAAPPAEQSERLLDYSPLYLALTRALAPGGYRAILTFQCLLHGVTAAAVALAVALLAGSGWGLAAGLGVACYRPFLVYCGIHEPEGLVLAALAVAVLLGLAVREKPEGRFSLLAAAGAAAGLAAAGLARPQHLVLVPVWAVWMGWKTSGGVRGDGTGLARRRLTLAAITLLVPTLLVVPLLVSRARATGVPTIMNPGAVFYEGNGPGATGLTRFAPQAVFALERAHREAYDYGHVAYRRIAGFSLGTLGHPVSPSLSNRYWTGLAFESLRAWPGRAFDRFGRKTVLALSPYEGQDLEIAEQLDRRLRARLPWGFFLPLVALPWIAFVSPERRRQLAGPLTIAVLAFVVQVALYASARQRLPLALALSIVGPVAAADLVRGRLGAAVRPAFAVLFGVAVAFGLAAATARYALLDQLGWDTVLGPEAPSLGSRLVAIGQGRAFRPELLLSARRFAAGVDLAERGHAADSLRTLAPLLGNGRDFTIDDKDVGVPEYWAARDLLALGDRPRATLAARVARATRPDDPRIAALALRLERPRGAPEPAPWRPPGTDPVSATLARAQAAAADGDRAGASALLRPLAGAFPEIASTPPL
jgi:hypothetical protein